MAKPWMAGPQANSFHPRSAIDEIIKGDRAISTATASAMGFFFNIEPQFWINLQSQYDIRRVQTEKASAIRAPVSTLVV